MANLQGEMLAALRAPLALAYGLATILVCTPMLALAIVRLPLQPPEMALGLAVFCCMPTSLSANIALTQVRDSAGLPRAAVLSRLQICFGCVYPI